MYEVAASSARNRNRRHDAWIAHQPVNAPNGIVKIHTNPASVSRAASLPLGHGPRPALL